MEERVSQWPRHPSLKKGRPGWVRVPGACHKCGGLGGSEAWRHTGWTCFRCHGSGGEPNGDRLWAYPVEWTDEQCAESAAVREAKAASRRAAKDAKKAEAWAAFKAEHGTAEEWEIAEAFGDGFVKELLWKGANFGSLSDRQIEVMGESIAKGFEREAAEAAERAALRPVPTGTVVIEGEVLTVRSQEGYMGRSELKMLVKGDGWKVWGTVPSALLSGMNPLKGAVVRFTASVERSDDDETFGFFKRPRKAEVLKEAPEEEEEA